MFKKKEKAKKKHKKTHTHTHIQTKPIRHEIGNHKTVNFFKTPEKKYVDKKKSTKITLSSFTVGHLLLSMQPSLKCDVYTFVRNCQLDIAPWLGMEAQVH